MVKKASVWRSSSIVSISQMDKERVDDFSEYNGSLFFCARRCVIIRGGHRSIGLFALGLETIGTQTSFVKSKNRFIPFLRFCCI